MLVQARRSQTWSKATYLLQQYRQSLWAESNGKGYQDARYYSTSREQAGQKLKILFLGRDEFSSLVLEEIYKARDIWDELVVATNPDQRVGRRGSQLSVSPLKLLAETCEDIRLEFIPPSKPEFREWKLPSPFLSYTCNSLAPGQASLDQPPPAHVLITASFGRILTQRHLSHFLPTRRLNVHPSLLPEYRGPAPIQHSLLNGDTETGVCVIEMLPAGKKQSDTRKVGIDAGDIWASKSVYQPGDATFSRMRDYLGVEGGKLLVEVLRDFKDQKQISPQPQCVGETALKSAPMVRLEDAQFSPITSTAEEASRRWRAIGHQRPISAILQVSPEVPSRAVQLYDLQVHAQQPDHSIEKCLAPYPGAVICSNSDPTNASEKVLFIRCRGGTILSVRKIKPEGKPVLDAQAFWNGVRKYKDIRFIGHAGL